MNKKLITSYDVLFDSKKHVKLKARESLDMDVKVTNEKAAVLVANKMFLLDQSAEEKLILLSLNAKGKVLGAFEVSHGNVNTTLAGNREIFIRLLLSGAFSFILLHNHVSGDVTPSNEDLSTVKRIKSASDIMGVKMFDFIIVGKGYLSFQQGGLI